MKRQKTVFLTSEVFHLWAHQTQEHATNSARNVYFNGPIIYSYGSHYPMARIVTDRGAVPFVLVSSRGYSPTTSGHTGAALAAVSHLRYMRVPRVEVDSGAAENIAYLIAETETALVKSARARVSWSRDSHLRQASELADNARFLADAYGIAADIPVVNAEAAAAARINLAVREKEMKKAETAEKKKARAEYLEKLAAQLGIAVAEIPESRHYLRLNPADPAETETTGGARVPTEHVRKAWPLIARLYAAGMTEPVYLNNGHAIPLGHYRIDRIDCDGTLVAGCHQFSRAEVERFARVLALV